jgi:endonuclease YncB( thermonuclease family)
MKRLMLLLSLGLGLSAQAAPMRWSDIRDGSLYLQTDRPDTLTIRWVPAWQADANEEHLYLLDGNGNLKGERLIAASETRGKQSWPLAPSAASYRLEIPGYSFRRYTIEHDEHTVALFAPAKVHFSAETRGGDELYFKVAPGEHAVLAGKFHGGINTLQAQRVSDNKQLSLALKPYRAYWQFDQVALPVTQDEQVWRLRLQGSGKVAFWLDGTANLFAQNPQQLKPLREDDGQTRLTLHKELLGPTPNLGIYLPYVLPPQSSFAALDALKPQAGTYYSFVDVTAQNPHHEDAFRQLYQNRFGIMQDLTLLAGSQRQADLRADTQSNAGLDAWLAATRALGGNGTHYIAFADEPNLNYPSYADYQAIFNSMARQVRSDPANAKAGVRIAMPATSRFVNGPFADNAVDKRGIDWARRLLAESGEQIDALAWHEWMIRDLLATRVYRDSVRRAAELVGLDAKGRPRKALLLDQTNLSSGSSLSPYDQETHFASLWWTSVVINSAQDGLLDMLNWFQAADEPTYPKGMVRVLDGDRFELKPVGLAQQFIQQHWLKNVMRLDNDAFEVDVLAMATERQRSVLGVNKGVRLQRVDLAGTTCPLTKGALVYFGADSRSRSAQFNCHDGRVSFDLPGETLFALSWSAS